MQVKIFKSEYGNLIQGINKPLIPIEEAINKFIKGKGNFQLIQSQSGDKGQFLTITILY